MTSLPRGVGEYAFLSDCRTAALVSRGGSVDWYAAGRFDGASIFGRILGAEAGHWSLAPADSGTVSRHYEPRTLILRTDHTTAKGSVSVVDALAQAPRTGAHRLGIRGSGTLLRVVEGTAGIVSMRLELLARPEYGLATPVCTLHRDRRQVEIEAGPVRLSLLSDVPLEVDGPRIFATFRASRGDRVGFVLRDLPPGAGIADPDREEAQHVRAARQLAATRRAWAAWSHAHQRYDGFARDDVASSAVVLQGLTYGPTGAIVAAATTSLPELPGGGLNWDYRYAWIRDAGYVMRAQWIAACPDEVNRYFGWLTRAIGPPTEVHTQIVYGVLGERLLHEIELPWLPGFDGSVPVRIGNDAWLQRQHDVMGQVLDTAYLLRTELRHRRAAYRDLLVSMANQAAKAWREPDSGMWEARDRERHYVSSKVMCWLALDRALALRIGNPSESHRWTEQRDKLREYVLTRGWHERVGAITGAIGSPDLDASVLLLPIVGFLPMHDPRMRSTVRAVERELSSDGFVRRWAGEPMAFLLASYWLVECLKLGRQQARARDLFQRLGALRNDVGLLAEMVDPDSGDLIGNLPQAFSHAGLINAAWQLNGGWRSRLTTGAGGQARLAQSDAS